jgi:hypothetical protein
MRSVRLLRDLCVCSKVLLCCLLQATFKIRAQVAFRRSGPLIEDRPMLLASSKSGEHGDTSAVSINGVDRRPGQYRFRYLLQFRYRTKCAIVWAQLLTDSCLFICVDYHCCACVWNLALLKLIHDLFFQMIVGTVVVKQSHRIRY